MTPYVFMILIWVVLFYYLLYRNEGISEEGMEKRRQIFVWLAGTTLFVIMGFRHNGVGVDTKHYLSRYHSTAYYDWDVFKHWDLWREEELGFLFFTKILYVWKIPFQVYLILYALFISICISKFILKWSKNPFWGFYLHATIGMFTMSMSGIRQSIACCICWLAIDYILEKKPVRFVLMVILASTFHQSAIFFLVFYFARYLKIKKISGWFFAGVSVASIFLRSIFTPILEYFMPEKYEIYGAVSDKYPINPLLVMVALLIPMFCLFFWERRKIKNERDDQFQSLCFVGSFAYAIIQVLGLSSNAIGRMCYYFYIFNVILLGNVITDIEDRNTRYIASAFAILLPGYMFFKAHSLGIAPYYFFWQVYGS
ncbi:MAG: EpsG family protein [Ruminococcaceae bacterium]|nr:EpsG family protein [Oscillospiraceae bacterium]